jgi:hypothetical protein
MNPLVTIPIGLFLGCLIWALGKKQILEILDGEDPYESEQRKRRLEWESEKQWFKEAYEKYDKRELHYKSAVYSPLSWLFFWKIRKCPFCSHFSIKYAHRTDIRENGIRDIEDITLYEKYFCPLCGLLEKIHELGDRYFYKHGVVTFVDINNRKIQLERMIRKSDKPCIKTKQENFLVENFSAYFKDFTKAQEQKMIIIINFKEKWIRPNDNTPKIKIEKLQFHNPLEE